MKYMGINMKKLSVFVVAGIMSIFMIAPAKVSAAYLATNVETMSDIPAPTAPDVDASPEETQISSEDDLLARTLEIIKQMREACTTRTSAIKTSHVSNFGYWVYRPTASTEEKLPLIVYLHGLDGCGSNVNGLLKIQGIPQYIDKGYITPNAVVIAPQCPKGKNWTVLSNDVMELINQVIVEENIDTNRVALTGASLGGIGTFNIAINNPDFFSCIVPVCGSVNAAKCNVLTKMNTKIFHGTKDYGMGFSVKTAHSVINANGGNSELIMLQGEGHEIRHIYIDAEYDIINWMISQERIPSQPEMLAEAAIAGDAQ